MTIDEILANNEKYEKEKSEFLSSVKKNLIVMLVKINYWQTL